jgi:hypothetical protein
MDDAKMRRIDCRKKVVIRMVIEEQKECTAYKIEEGPWFRIAWQADVHIRMDLPCRVVYLSKTKAVIPTLILIVVCQSDTQKMK